MTAGVDLFADLARKMEILEQELKVQRTAIDRLKQMGFDARQSGAETDAPARKSA
jgi:hypothetical protein